MSGTPREFRPERIFAVLAEADVGYVAVGAFALIAHGVVRATEDVDIIPEPDPENFVRLANAIRALGGTPFGEPRTPVTPELVARDANMRFQTEAGPLDILCADPYRRGFTELRSRSVVGDINGLPIRVVSRNDLIRLKAGTGRDRDILDIGDLLALDE